MKRFRIPYASWKTVVQANSWTVYENLQGADSSYSYSGNRDYIYGCTVDADDWADYTTVFPTRTSVTTIEEAEALIYGLSNKEELKTSEGLMKMSLDKSFQDSSKSFVSHDYSNKASWFYKSVEVADEVATTSDNLTYSYGSGKTIIDLDLVTDRQDWLQKGITIKKNDVVITTGFTVNLGSNNVVFDTALLGTDVVKVSYAYENGSEFELIASAGKKILLSYVETQFSIGTVFPANDYMLFELVLNNPNVGGQDYVAATVEYKTAKDFLNKGNNGSVLRAFGELTKDVNIFPWNYMTGFIVKPFGDATTDPTKNEFNKIRIKMKNNGVYTNCDIATGTFYCRIENL